MWARVIEVGVGFAFAGATIAYSVFQARARFRRRHPNAGQVWQSSPRSLRRRVRLAIRHGRAIGCADAIPAIDGIDLTLKLRRAQRIGKRQPPLGRRLLSYGAGFLIAVVVAAIAGSTLSAFAAIYVGYFGVFALLAAVALVQRRDWDERWLPRLRAARQSAADALTRAMPL